MKDEMRELGRFAEPSLYILVALSDGPKHGYAIMTDVEAGYGRPMGPGTLYAALARLEERGLIEALEPVDRRRPYRLTAVGATVLEEQLQDLAGFAPARRPSSSPTASRPSATPTRSSSWTTGRSSSRATTRRSSHAAGSTPTSTRASSRSRSPRPSS